MWTQVLDCFDARSNAISISRSEVEVDRVSDDSVTRDDTIRVVVPMYQQRDHNTDASVKEDIEQSQGCEGPGDPVEKEKKKG